MAVKILAFAGSLRKDSYNKKLVKVAVEGARAAGAEVTYIDLADFDLPLYNQDIEDAGGIPEQALKLKRIFFEHQGLLISCPEYNSSISGALKNAIDWVTRPEPDEPPLRDIRGKVAALLAASPGALGGLRGLVTVRSILGNIRVVVLPEQRAVPKANEAFDEQGQLRDAKLRDEIVGIGRTLAEATRKLHG
ncbi:MAG TPA: NAD(P)H-dependent oxidoreductase [Phycisphaerae bacterium]|nr:NAD(P)H-dependent oxidoreductase [Phycisphaerae bacterium]